MLAISVRGHLARALSRISRTRTVYTRLAAVTLLFSLAATLASAASVRGFVTDAADFVRKFHQAGAGLAGRRLDKIQNLPRPQAPALMDVEAAQALQFFRAFTPPAPHEKHGERAYENQCGGEQNLRSTDAGDHNEHRDGR